MIANNRSFIKQMATNDKFENSNAYEEVWEERSGVRLKEARMSVLDDERKDKAEG